MTAEKVINLYLKQIESIVKLYCQVVDILNQVPLDLWWAQMLAASEDNKKKGYIINYGKDDLTQQEIKEHVLNIQSSFKGQLVTIPDYKDNLERSTKKITQSILPPDSGLRRFLNGRSKERPNQTDFWHYTCFSIWLEIRIRSFACKRLNRDWEEMNYDELMSDLSYLLLVTRMNSASLDGEDFDQVVNLGDLIKSQVFRETVEGVDAEYLKPTELTTACVELYHQLVDDFAIPELYKFFYLLNSCFVDDFTKRGIIKLFQEHPFNKQIDNVYIFFKADHSDISKDYSFVPGKQNLKTEDIIWKGKRDESCFHFSIGSKEIQSLYEKLVRGRYISKDTDIISFAHILTGLPYGKPQQTIPINWIYDEKSVLAMFAGELRNNSRKSDGNNKLTWTTIRNLFYYKGLPIDSNLSTLYSQALLRKDNVCQVVIELASELIKKEDI